MLGLKAWVLKVEEIMSLTDPPQALSYWGGNVFQNNAPLIKAFEATSFRKRKKDPGYNTRQQH